jgi:hypothetical protein
MDLEKSQRVFENFTQLADLSRAHGSLFRGRGQIIIEAFFEIPFEQLYALFHADFLRTTAARLMDGLELNDSTHRNSVE